MLKNMCHYDMSDDYELMKKLLDYGPLFGSIDFRGPGDTVSRDCCIIRRVPAGEGRPEGYTVSIRGLIYDCSYATEEEPDAWKSFEGSCAARHLQYALPCRFQRERR